MAMYFLYPFAIAGDRTTVAQPTQLDGTVSWQSGYGINYSQNPANPLTPNGKNFPRFQHNEILYQITLALQQYQQWGLPDFITTSDNGGVPFPYAQYAQVLYDPGTGKQPYQSLVNSNTALPTDATKWTPVTVSAGADISAIQSAQYIFGNDTGVANAYVVAPAPALTTSTYLLLVLINNGNTGASTINAGGGAISLKKPGIQGSNLPQALTGGELEQGNYYLIYSNGSQAVVLNPSQILSDAVTPTQLRNQTYTAVTDTGGSANTYVANFSPTFTVGFNSLLWVLIQHTNTGASTLSVNGDTRNIIKPNGFTTAGFSVPLVGGELAAGYWACFISSGSTYSLINALLPTALYAQISLTGSQTIGAMATTTVNFNNIDADPFNMVTLPPNPSSLPAFTVIKKGRYKLTVILGGTTNATNTNNFVYFVVNGTPIRTLFVPFNVLLTSPVVVSGEIEATLNVGDVVSIQFSNQNTAVFNLTNTGALVGCNVFQISQVGVA